MAVDSELEAEVVALTRSEGKFVAIQRYRRATGASVKRARWAVEEILFRHGVFSMNPPRFRNWGGHLLVAISAFVGLSLALALVLLFEKLVAALYVVGIMLLLTGAIGFPNRRPPAAAIDATSPGTERLIRAMCILLGITALVLGVWTATPTERERLVWFTLGAGAGLLVAWLVIRRVWLSE